MVGGLGWIFAGTRLHVSGGSHVFCLIKMKWGMFVEDLPNIIPVKFDFNLLSSFKEYIYNVYIFFFAYWPIKNNNDRGDHIFFFIKTKQETFEKVLLNIIPSKFGYNWPRSFNEDCNVKSLGDRRQVMAILAHMILCVRSAKTYDWKCNTYIRHSFLSILPYITSRYNS